MAAPYSKPSQQLFWDLVNKSNPQLRIPLSDNNCVVYGYPVAQNPTTGNGQRNTRIRLYAKVGMGYSGELTVNYNRLNLTSLFTGNDPKITNYAADTSETVIAAFNAAYGLSLKYARLSTGSQPAWTIGMDIPDLIPNSTYLSGNYYSDNNRSHSAAPESLCWIGTINITRIKGNPDLGVLITKPELMDSRRIVVPEEGKLNIPLLTYGIDFTSKADVIALFRSNSSNRSYQNQFVAMLAEVTGLPFTFSTTQYAASLEKLDLYGMTVQNYAVAKGTQHYYNTEDYTNCLILYTNSPQGTMWSKDFYGVLDQDVDVTSVNKNVGVFIHYNP